MLCVSFMAPKALNNMDVRDLTLTIPSIHYEDKTWSSHEFANHLKFDIVKIVLAHAPLILGNRILRKPLRNGGQARPLRQMSDFTLCMTLEELHKQGRSRDGRGEAGEKGV